MFIYEKDVMDCDIDVLLDSIETDPFERELIRENLHEAVKLKDAGAVRYRVDLLLEWLAYYKKNTGLPMIFEIICFNDNLSDILCDAFKKYLDEFNCESYDGATHTVAPNTKAIIALHKNLEVTKDIMSKLYHISATNKKTARKLTPSLILEILGPKLASDGSTDIACVMYDRKYSMKGIVTFNV